MITLKTNLSYFVELSKLCRHYIIFFEIILFFVVNNMIILLYYTYKYGDWRNMMKNTIIDFVLWRGDLTAQQQSFQQIDYLILSNLAYIQFDHIIDSTPHFHLTLSQAYDLYQKQNLEINDESHQLFQIVSQSPRYQNIQIISYINEIDKELVKQFAAITFLLENQTLFIAYRGTDSSLVGWHEDFLMLCENVVSSQISAVHYLQKIGQLPYQQTFIQDFKNKNLGTVKERIIKHFQYKKNGFPILLGGHSKGGNLAMYAGCFIEPKIQDRIIKIYNYDGPGFQDEIMQSSQYKKMLPRIMSYIPHYSFFGIVLGHEETYKVVHSENNGMLQHNTFSWSVTPQGFIEDELSYESVQFAIQVILFLEKMNFHERKVFVETMFSLFDSLNLHTFDELSHITYKQILSAIKELTLLDSQMRKMLIEVLHMLWLESKKTKKKKEKKSK